MKISTVSQINKGLASIASIRAEAFQFSMSAWLNAITSGNTQQFDALTEMSKFVSRDEKASLQVLFKNLPISKDKETKLYEGVKISGRIAKSIMFDLQEALSKAVGVEHTRDMSNVIAVFKGTNDLTPSTLLNAITIEMSKNEEFDIPVAPDGKLTDIKTFKSLLDGVTIGAKSITVNKPESDDDKEKASVIAKLAMGRFDTTNLSDTTAKRIQDQFTVALQMLQDAHIEAEHTKAGIKKAKSA